MRLRRFLAFFGGAQIPWPIVAAAQPADRVRRVGVLFPARPPGSEAGSPGMAAFQRQLRELGWIEGSNLRLDVRYAPVYAVFARADEVIE